MGESKKKKLKQATPPLAETPVGPAAAAEAAAPADAEAPPPPLPISSAPLPLTRLVADQLGAFLELCFPDRRLVELCRELKIITPGYRLEALPPEQVALILAEEYLQSEGLRPQLETAVREQLRSPMLEGRGLTLESLGDALQDTIDAIAFGDPLGHLARVVWAGILVDDKVAHQAAIDALSEGLRALEGPRPKGPEAPGAKEARKAVQEARKQVAAAEKKQGRSERESESLRDQLGAARAALATVEGALAEERSALDAARAESTRLLAELQRLTGEGAQRLLAEARRTEAESRALAERLQRSEEARAAALAENEGLEKRLVAAEERARTTGLAAPQEPAELPTEEESATFLVPVLTREFYDSIERWSRRMQRAAFDKIQLLANDWRHGSLRALALEGLPGYYRIRVATDVRLIYRREGNQLEILSLIDREDLDRYVRQARTRPT